jgi:3-methyladenine DNA glycosylase AlkD
MKCEEVIRKLKRMKDPRAIEGMARYGIVGKGRLGISIPALRNMAREIGKDHGLALKLWRSGIPDARILAALVDEPSRVTERQMERWVKDFDSWDVCDQVCSNLFDRTAFAASRAFEWGGREEEFVKRAGFVLMAAMAVHDKGAGDRIFKRFLPIIKRESTDERNFVKKAVNWALRQIGKRNLALNREAVRLAGEIRKIDSRAARWIASDAIRELTSPRVRNALPGKQIARQKARRRKMPPVRHRTE